jgi:hypothetical protein
MSSTKKPIRHRESPFFVLRVCVGACVNWAEARVPRRLLANTTPANTTPNWRQLNRPSPYQLPSPSLVGAAAAGLALRGVPVVAGASVAGHVDVCGAPADT